MAIFLPPKIRHLGEISGVLCLLLIAIFLMQGCFCEFPLLLLKMELNLRRPREAE